MIRIPLIYKIQRFLEKTRTTTLHALLLMDCHHMIFTDSKHIHGLSSKFTNSNKTTKSTAFVS